MEKRMHSRSKLSYNRDQIIWSRFKMTDEKKTVSGFNYKWNPKELWDYYKNGYRSNDSTACRRGKKNTPSAKNESSTPHYLEGLYSNV